MAGYTKLLANEIREITGRYRLEITSYQQIQQGAGNSNYLVNAKQGKYILTIFEIEPSRVKEMSKVLLMIDQHTFPAPRIHDLPNGDLLTDYQGKSNSPS